MVLPLAVAMIWPLLTIVPEKTEALKRRPVELISMPVPFTRAFAEIVPPLLRPPAKVVAVTSMPRA